MRNAKHTIFPHHAIPKDLEISSRDRFPRHDEIDEHPRNLMEKVILNKSADGNHSETMSQFAQDAKKGKNQPVQFATLCDLEDPFPSEQSCFLTIVKTEVECMAYPISLKPGEAEFLQRASVVQRCGVAVVIMAFDAQDQAATYENKIRSCQRSYNPLREQTDLNAQDIMFDCHVLMIATGVRQHSMGIYNI